MDKIIEIGRQGLFYVGLIFGGVIILLVILFYEALNYLHELRMFKKRKRNG